MSKSKRGGKGKITAIKAGREDSKVWAREN